MMKGLAVFMFLFLLMGCGSPIKFTTDDGPTWVRDLSSRLEEDESKIRAPKGKRTTTPKTPETVNDEVVPLPVPESAEKLDPEGKPEWVTDLEDRTTVPKVGKKQREQVTIKDDLVNERKDEIPPPVEEPVVEEPKRNGKVDIVFIVDASNSMDPFLRKVRDTFRGFIQTLAPLDWKMMFTNADHGQHGFFLANWGARKGRAMKLERDGELIWEDKYLTKQTEDYGTVFIDTLRLHDMYEYMESHGGDSDQEKGSCELAPGCQGWNEQPLKSMKASFVRNRSFFRPGVDVAVVLFSDSDEGEHTEPEKRVKSQEVLEAFQKEWGEEGKRLMSYGIIMIPGEDEECMKKYNSGFWGGEGVLGVELARMAKLTGGKNISLCSDSYLPIAHQIVSDFQ